MHIPPIHYLAWAKRHAPVRYELTASGVPAADLADFDAALDHVDPHVRGADGHPRWIERIARRYGVDPARVVPVPGCSSGVFIALATCASRGDAIAVEQPAYPSLTRVSEFLGLRVVPLPRTPDARFLPRTERIAAALESGARAVVLTNLHNPSARIIPRDTMATIASLCAARGAVLIVDEVYLDYAHVNLDATRWTAASLGNHVVTLNSLTKVYGLGGLRAGWMLVPAHSARRARRMMDYLSVHVAGPSSSLAIRAFDRIDRLAARTRRLYDQGRPVFEAWLRDQTRLSASPNHGAMFAWVRLPRGVRAGTLNTLLVRHYRTRVVPGEFFGAADHFRISLGVPPDDLAVALANISDALQRLS